MGTCSCSLWNAQGDPIGVTPGLEVDPSGSRTSARGRTISGGHGDRDTPVPIPNTAVKPVSADGTWGVAPWESRTPPGFLRRSPPLCGGLLRVHPQWSRRGDVGDRRMRRLCGRHDSCPLGVGDDRGIRTQLSQAVMADPPVPATSPMGRSVPMGPDDLLRPAAPLTRPPSHRGRTNDRIHHIHHDCLLAPLILSVAGWRPVGHSVPSLTGLRNERDVHAQAGLRSRLLAAHGRHVEATLCHPDVE